jgi:membrane-bound lytic murein transglycosylase A
VSERPEPPSSRSIALLRSFVLLVVLSAAALVALWRDRGRPTSPTPALPPLLALEPAEFRDLEGWSEDPLDGFAPALAKSCAAAAAAQRSTPAASAAGDSITPPPEDWRRVCARAEAAATDPAALRQVLAKELRPWSVRDRARDQGLLTGYFEPLLHGSLRRTDRYHVPLYLRPPELVDVDLGSFRSDLRGRRIAGRVRGDRLVPFADRASLEQGALDGRRLELVWVDDAIDAFFLHIQGSGRIALEDGSELRVGYAAQNGHPYVAIGRELVARGELALEDVTMQSIRAWLEAHPADAAALMNKNPSFVFFRELEGPGPVGSQGVALTPYRSIAVDTAFLPLGLPVWLDGSWPPPVAGEPDRPLRRLVVAQDTGGAIRGPLRADLFCGYGAEAAEIAGRLKHETRLWLLLPRDFYPRPGGRAAP